MMQWTGTTALSSNGTKTNDQAGSGGSNKTPMEYTLCLHPLLWGRDEVQNWLNWCVEEFSFTDVQAEKFSMNGKALVLLKKEDFIERAPYSGDVLYNILQKLMDTHSKTAPAGNLSSGGGLVENQALFNMFLGPMMGQHLLYAQRLLGLPNVSMGNALSPGSLNSLSSSTQSVSPVPLSTSQFRASIVNQPPPVTTTTSPSSMSGVVVCKEEKVAPQSFPTLVSRAVQPSHMSLPSNYVKQEQHLNVDNGDVLSDRPKTDCRLLWEFISKLLQDSQFRSYIRWENESDYTFRIVNPAQLSRLWGIQKNRTNMTYEKLSRALRYYYRMDIIEKVPGRRLTYRFMRPPHEIKRGQRGAKPGVPRKVKTSEDSTEDNPNIEGYNSEDPIEDSVMDEGSDTELRGRLSSNDFESNEPLDLVSYSHKNTNGNLDSVQKSVHTASVIRGPSTSESPGIHI